jgi:hypothetical protein
MQIYGRTNESTVVVVYVDNIWCAIIFNLTPTPYLLLYNNQTQNIGVVTELASLQSMTTLMTDRYSKT